MAHINKLYSFILSRQKEPIIIKSVSDTRKVREATPEKTQELIFWGLSQKKIMQHLIFNPHHLSFFCLNCQVVQNISAENENKRETTHTHTHMINNCVIRCFGLKTSVYEKNDLWQTRIGEQKTVASTSIEILFKLKPGHMTLSQNMNLTQP